MSIDFYTMVAKVAEIYFLFASLYANEFKKAVAQDFEMKLK
jgi:hypothetical protein